MSLGCVTVEDYNSLSEALDYALTYGCQPSDEWVQACYKSREEARHLLQSALGQTAGLHKPSQIAPEGKLRFYKNIMYGVVGQEAKQSFDYWVAKPVGHDATVCMVSSSGAVMSVNSVFLPHDDTWATVVEHVVGCPITLYQKLQEDIDIPTVQELFVTPAI